MNHSAHLHTVMNIEEQTKANELEIETKTFVNSHPTQMYIACSFTTMNLPFFPSGLSLLLHLLE